MPMSKITYLSVKETAKRWHMSERSVRNYCLQGRIVGALLEGKTWIIPSDAEMKSLLMEYNSKSEITLDNVLDFHARFEAIHPFQDGNGCIGRLILFKECLKHTIVPFIITEELKLYYYRGIKNWKNERGFLRDTCLTAQDVMKQCLDYFGIVHR